MFCYTPLCSWTYFTHSQKNIYRPNKNVTVNPLSRPHNNQFGSRRNLVPSINPSLAVERSLDNSISSTDYECEMKHLICDSRLSDESLTTAKVLLAIMLISVFVYILLLQKNCCKMLVWQRAKCEGDLKIVQPHALCTRSLTSYRFEHDTIRWNRNGSILSRQFLSNSRQTQVAARRLFAFFLL